VIVPGTSYTVRPARTNALANGRPYDPVPYSPQMRPSYWAVRLIASAYPAGLASIAKLSSTSPTRLMTTMLCVSRCVSTPAKNSNATLRDENDEAVGTTLVSNTNTRLTSQRPRRRKAPNGRSKASHEGYHPVSQNGRHPNYSPKVTLSLSKGERTS